jgi:hypothetical protein
MSTTKTPATPAQSPAAAKENSAPSSTETPAKFGAKTPSRTPARGGAAATPRRTPQILQGRVAKSGAKRTWADAVKMNIRNSALKPKATQVSLRLEMP